MTKNPEQTAQNSEPKDTTSRVFEAFTFLRLLQEATVPLLDHPSTVTDHSSDPIDQAPLLVDDTFQF